MVVAVITSKDLNKQGGGTETSCLHDLMVAEDCGLTPYVPADKWDIVRRVFGANNVETLLQVLPEHERKDAAGVLTYLADKRYRDSDSDGTAEAISPHLQQQIHKLQTQLEAEFQMHIDKLEALHQMAVPDQTTGKIVVILTIISGTALKDTRHVLSNKVLARITLAGDKMTKESDRDKVNGLNPIWNYTVYYELPKTRVTDEHVHVRVSLYDKSKLVKHFIGEVQIDLGELYAASKTRKEYTLKLVGTGSVYAGELKIACAFEKEGYMTESETAEHGNKYHKMGETIGGDVLSALASVITIIAACGDLATMA